MMGCISFLQIVATLLLALWVDHTESFQAGSRHPPSNGRLVAGSLRVPHSTDRTTTTPSNRRILSPLASTTTTTSDAPPPPSLGATLRKLGLSLYVVGMCVALPATLLPQQLLYRLKLISLERLQDWATPTAAFCSRWLFRLIPFCRIRVQHYDDDDDDNDDGSTNHPTTNGSSSAEAAAPRIWVCNHCSMLDVFLLLAAHHRLGCTRSVHVLYWQQLEDNFVTKLLFQQAGFIPVQMKDNGHGNANEYDAQSFKRVLVASKQALAAGHDLGILPEGQLNPTPENGLLPLFTGAYSLARKRTPIQLLAMHGAQHVWHPLRGMVGEGRAVDMAVYHPARVYKDPTDFTQTIQTVIGTFGATGKNAPDWKEWASGRAFQAQQQRAEEEQAKQLKEEAAKLAKQQQQDETVAARDEPEPITASNET